MIVKNSFTQICLAFARPMWTHFRKDFLWMIWGTVAAVAVSTIFPNLPLGAFGLPLFIIHGFRYTSAGMGLLLFVGCYSLASKVGGNFEPGVDSRRVSISLYTLPLTTRHLVLAPMVAAIFSVAAFWVVFWVLAVLPYGGNVPLVLPILLTSLMICSSQAANWTIYIRAGLGCLFFMISVGAPVLAVAGMANHVPMWTMNTIASALISVSIWQALRNAPVSRNSVTTKFTTAALEKRAQKDATRTQGRKIPTLSSPLASQLWFYKVNVLRAITMIFVGIAAAWMLIRIQSSTSDLVGSGRVRMLPDVFQFWYLLAIAAFIAVFFTTIIAMTANGVPTKDQKTLPPLPTFTAIRPITTAQLVASQAIVAFQSALATSYVVWIAIVIWMLSPIEVDGKAVWMFKYLMAEASVSRALLVLLVAACYPLIVFSLQMASMVRSRLPIRLGRILGFIPTMAIFGLVEISVFTKFPNGEDIFNVTKSLFPVEIGLLFVKVILIPIAQVKLEQNKLLSRDTFLKSATIWIVTVIVLTSAFYALLPAGLHSLAQISALVALTVPANRILWQIYCLDQTRHVGATK